MTRFQHFLRREPLLHFAAITALLFLIDALRPDNTLETVRVDKATQKFLIKQQEDLLLRPLSEQEVEELIQDFVDEEILVREAKKRGLDNNSPVRRLLIQNMRFFLTDATQEPDVAELRHFFESNRSRYETPALLSMDHVFFRTEEDVPGGLLASLEAGLDSQTVGEEKFGVGRRIIGFSQRQLVGLLGSEGAAEMLAEEDGEWRGPIRSPRGVHFLRIIERIPPRVPVFEETATWIRQEWERARAQETTERALTEMRLGYEIDIEALGSDE